jgi:hypothetical protein
MQNPSTATQIIGNWCQKWDYINPLDWIGLLNSENCVRTGLNTNDRNIWQLVDNIERKKAEMKTKQEGM